MSLGEGRGKGAMDNTEPKEFDITFDAYLEHHQRTVYSLLPVLFSGSVGLDLFQPVEGKRKKIILVKIYIVLNYLFANNQLQLDSFGKTVQLLH